jgi:hypothetical protein
MNPLVIPVNICMILVADTFPPLFVGLPDQEPFRVFLVPPNAAPVQGGLLVDPE